MKLSGMSMTFIGLACLISLLLCVTVFWVIGDKAAAKEKYYDDLEELQHSSERENEKATKTVGSKWKDLVTLMPSGEATD